ncbi:kynureninase [Ramlibacter tataouinensis]|uniref:Kynureninase n=1 Tax=Ramlibacter tataouinensis (strain ATCC BAA-407 / DSM 14655 / LMG 21543 / TTB310) TaxID=365046 RepID=F5Y555_RAMTT|nr:kynureninase [Ramlibacter tataouinensis]AEG93895.1 kynureninase (L-kynurenine hydrolase)-like protein [Ramlibacter tataouinensis TTB310]
MTAISLHDCRSRDAADPLRPLRDLFALPPGVIYLDGNSLGPLPRATAARVARAVEQEWGQGLIRSWNDAGWFEMPGRVGDRIAAWIGAGAGEVVATDTTSINLYKVLSAALQIAAQDAPGRRVVLSERSNFPTDLYIAQALCRQQGCTLRLVEAQELPAALDGEVAVLMLTHVNYRSGAMHDMAALTRAAHEAGALAVWDLAHSAGAVPVHLHDAQADFAIGCGYKYFNGGPGAPAFVWVHPRHAERFWQPLAGWWGHDAPFAFTPEYVPAPGIGRYLCGTQPVLAMVALACGLDTLEASLPHGGMRALRAKSLALTDLFIALVEQRCGDAGLRLVTPRDHAQRGSQVCLSYQGPHARHCVSSLPPEGAVPALGQPGDGHAEGAYAMVQALIARGVVGDYRAPDILRFGFTPLYLGFEDVWKAVEQLGQVLDSGEWRRPEFGRRQAVT